MSDDLLAQIAEGLTKPATVLIEKVAEAANIRYEPKHVVKMAIAQAEAAEIKAESDIKIADLEQRALLRWIREESLHQKNMEDTTAKAIPKLNEDADPHAIKDDWIIKFFDKCRLITDDEVQDLWASILAGEANSAGSYSPKTLTTLADMNQKSLSLFSDFCSLCLVNLDDPNEFLNSPPYFKIKEARLPIIRGIINDVGTLPSSRQDLDKFAQESISIYHKYGFGINEFHLLLEHGLIQEDNTTHRYSSFWYNNKIYVILNQQEITISGFYLTSVGKELFHIAKPTGSPKYLSAIIDFLQRYYDVKISIFSKRRKQKGRKRTGQPK